MSSFKRQLEAAQKRAERLGWVIKRRQSFFNGRDLRVFKIVDRTGKALLGGPSGEATFEQVLDYIMGGEIGAEPKRPRRWLTPIHPGRWGHGD